MLNLQEPNRVRAASSSVVCAALAVMSGSPTELSAADWPVSPTAGRLTANMYSRFAESTWTSADLVSSKIFDKFDARELLSTEMRVYPDDIFFSRSSLGPVAANDDVRVVQSVHASAQLSKSNLLSDLLGFKDVGANWDGMGALAPIPGAVDDALVVAEMWPSTLRQPVPDIDCDGCVTLDIFDTQGYCLGGVVFGGESHLASFTVVGGSNIIKSDNFDASSSTDILATFAVLADYFA